MTKRGIGAETNPANPANPASTGGALRVVFDDSAHSKPSLQERIGGAVSGGRLASVAGREGAGDLVAALALTQINPGAGEHGERDDAQIDPRAEVAAVLLRIKAGGQLRDAGRAIDLLVNWIRNQRAFSKWKIKSGHGILHSFVAQSLAEWLFQACPACRGTRSVGIERDAVVSRPVKIRCNECKGKGFKVLQSRNRMGYVRHPCGACQSFGHAMHDRVEKVKPGDCSTCRGTGRAMVNDSQRARALGVSFDIYQRHWLRRFAWLASRLDYLEGHQNRLLQSARGGRINPIP